MISSKSTKVIGNLKAKPTLSWKDRRYQRFYKVVDQVVAKLQEHVWVELGKTKRRLAGTDLDRLSYSVECLIRDCVAIVLQRERKAEASIKKGHHQYDGSRPDKMLTYNIHIQRAFEGLIELGYIEISKPGYFDRKGRKDGTPTSRLTRYIATTKLLSHFTDNELKSLPAIIPPYIDPELIKVRVKEKDEDGVTRRKSLAVKETSDTKRMRQNLMVINKALSKHWYDLEIPDEELSELQKRLAHDVVNERTIRMDQRSVYRVFNDPKLETGGRFYGGWWQNIPKEYRQHLAVNGKKMVELDYSNQHPTILYAWAGLDRPADCYSGVIKMTDVLDGTSPSELRDMVKASFNAMLNSPKPLRQAPTGIRPAAFGLKWSDVSSAIAEFHKPISHHFYTGVGLELQRIDSDIAEAVMLHFAKRQIAILPLHDSFIMHSGYETSLEPVMRDAFQSVVGLTPKIDKKVTSGIVKGSEQNCDAELGPNTTDDIIQLMQELDVGYEHRLAAFRVVRSS